MNPAYPIIQRDDRDRYLVMVVLVVVCSLVMGAPLLFVLIASIRGPSDYLPIEDGAHWTLGNFINFYSDRSLYTEILPNTVVLAGGSLLLSCSMALALAWQFERAASRSNTWARIMILLPLALPTPALAIAWIRLLGPNVGWFNEMWRALTNSSPDSGPLNIFSMAGLIWCQGTAGIPVAYLLLSPAVKSVRRDLEEAAHVSGAGPLKTFLRITLPTAAQAFSGPLLIMCVVALEQVDFPYIIGPTAGINVLGTRIMYEMSSPSGLPNIGAISAAALLLLILSSVCLALNGFLNKRSIGAAGVGLQGRRSSTPGGDAFRKWWVWVLVVVYFAIAFAAPVLALLLSAAPAVGVGNGVSGNGCCGHVLHDMVHSSRFWGAWKDTLLVAGFSAVVGTLVGLAISLCCFGRKDPISRCLDNLSISSIAIPPVIIAFGMAIVFLSIPFGLYGTIGALMVAYCYRIAVSTRMTSGAMAQIGDSMQDAATVCGVRWARIQISIVIPLIAPSIFFSAVFLFIVGIKEFAIPLMLSSPGSNVLSVMLLQQNQAGDTVAAAVTAIGMMLFAALGVIGLVCAETSFAKAWGRR